MCITHPQFVYPHQSEESVKKKFFILKKIIEIIIKIIIKIIKIIIIEKKYVQTYLNAQRDH